MNEKYEAVIGLEVHAQLLTNSKAFSWSANEYGASPNSCTDPVTLGMPGALPRLNRQVVDYAIKMGLATHCNIRPFTGFARKNYFYPDLPKGYQISQFDDPICYEGSVEIEMEDGERKSIRIERIHIEEDSGKSIHDLDFDTLIDLNRAGAPLIEIVSGPDMRSARQAYLYMMQVRQIVVYLGICSGNMEEGALRCDANVSVMLKGADKFGTKTEVKNINSFKNLEKAIEFEIKRQIEVIEAGGTIEQQTRMWDASTGTTKLMRTKEMAHDYRYFPEPDLPPLRIDPHWIQTIADQMTELPLQRKDRLVAEYGIPSYDAAIFVEEKELADYYEKCCSFLKNKDEKHYKGVSNWVMTEVMRIKSAKNLKAEELEIKPEYIAELVELIESDVISTRIAKEIFPEIEAGNSPAEIVEQKGLKQMSDTGELDEMIKKIVERNPDSVEKYRAGRSNLFGFFVGQVMKQTGGQANPRIVSDLVKKYLDV